MTTPKKPATPFAPLLTISQACAALNIGRTLIYELMRDGKLPYTEMGPQTRRFHPEAIRHFRLHGSTVPVPAMVDPTWDPRASAAEVAAAAGGSDAEV